MAQRLIKTPYRDLFLDNEKYIGFSIEGRVQYDRIKLFFFLIFKTNPSSCWITRLAIQRKQTRSKMTSIAQPLTDFNRKSSTLDILILISFPPNTSPTEYIQIDQYHYERTLIKNDQTKNIKTKN